MEQRKPIWCSHLYKCIQNLQTQEEQAYIENVDSSQNRRGLRRCEDPESIVRIQRNKRILQISLPRGRNDPGGTQAETSTSTSRAGRPRQRTQCHPPRQAPV